MDWNKVPNNVRYLVEALRGGSETRFDESGNIASQKFFKPSNLRKPQRVMPRNLREYQLHNQEAAMGQQEKKGYSDFLREQD